MKKIINPDHEYYQTMLRIYLRSVRDENGWTQQDLADKMGVSKPTIEKLEGKSAIRSTRVIESLTYLKSFADLKGIGTDSFVSILLGKLNEAGETGGAFSQEIATDISNLSNVAQVHLKTGLQDQKNAEEGSVIFSSYIKANQSKRNLYKKISQLTDSQVKVLHGVIDSFGG